MKTEEKTPREVALELVEKFKPLVTTWDCYNDIPVSDEDVLKDAKKCAFVAVEYHRIAFEDLSLELNKVPQSLTVLEHGNGISKFTNAHRKHIIEVKQEINNLKKNAN